MNSCLKCKNGQSEYFRKSESPFNYNEIFAAHSIGKNEIKVLQSGTNKKIARCKNCNAVWLIKIEDSGPIYTDFNRTDPRDTAPDSYGITTVHAKIIKEEEIQNFLG